MQSIGRQLSASACVDEALARVEGCQEQQTNAVVCQQAVKIQVFHCLDAAGFAAHEGVCEDHLAEHEDETNDKWVYTTCTERGRGCFSKRECACAEAVRAFDSYCRTKGEGVQL